MKKVAIYIRVSTREQAEKGYSIEAQQEKLINYCKAKDWNIYDIYIDGGFSGSNIDRPAMQKLLKNINNFDIVLVYKLDRLSRSQKDTLYLIEEKLLPNDVDFVSLQETLDTTSAFGRAMIGILSVFAQLERETITERSRLGRLQRAKKGLWSGGGNDPTGYDYDIEKQKLIINEYEAMQVREIFDLYLSGKGINAINNVMIDKGYTVKGRKWNTTTDGRVKKILKNELYIGKINFKDELFKGIHEPIISEEDFKSVQSIFARRKKKFKNYNRGKYLLTGVVYCGECGDGYMVNQVTNHKYNYNYKYYSCNSKRRAKPKTIKNHSCDNRNFRMEKLDRYIYDEINKLSLNKKLLKSLFLENKEEDTGSVNLDKINEIDKQIDRLMNLYQSGNIPTNIISERIEVLYEEKKALERLINSNESDEGLSFEEVSNLLDSFEIVWKYGTIEEKKQIISTIIDRVIIYKDKIDIEWAL